MIFCEFRISYRAQTAEEKLVQLESMIEEYKNITTRLLSEREGN